MSVKYYLFIQDLGSQRSWNDFFKVTKGRDTISGSNGVMKIVGIF